MASQKGLALQFVVLLGLVSLFGDVTYEGARSVTGPYLAVLGASATIVGLVTGFGEFSGYAFRLLSGYLADKTRAYWSIAFIGYGLLFSVPLLALAGGWEVAAVLIVIERLGRGIRTPSRDTMLSHAAKQVGRGWGFAIHEAIDQVGAIIGSITFSLIFFFGFGYREGFSIMWVPFLLVLAFLGFARFRMPHPERLEPTREPKRPRERAALSRVFWFYILFSSLAVAGFAHFQLISYHTKVQFIASDTQIPVLYAVAMGTDAPVALAIGRTYDRLGLSSLIIIPVLTLPIPFLGFGQSLELVFLGVAAWGAIMGIHETVMRAGIADLTPAEQRAFAYGVFNTAYGASLMLGSFAMGFLYELSIAYLLAFVLIMELASIPAFLLVRRSAATLRKSAI